MDARISTFDRVGWRSALMAKFGRFHKIKEVQVFEGASLVAIIHLSASSPVVTVAKGPTGIVEVVSMANPEVISQPTGWLYRFRNRVTVVKA